MQKAEKMINAKNFLSFANKLSFNWLAMFLPSVIIQKHAERCGKAHSQEVCTTNELREREKPEEQSGGDCWYKIMLAEKILNHNSCQLLWQCSWNFFCVLCLELCLNRWIKIVFEPKVNMKVLIVTVRQTFRLERRFRPASVIALASLHTSPCYSI